MAKNLRERLDDTLGQLKVKRQPQEPKYLSIQAQIYPESGRFNDKLIQSIVGINRKPILNGIGGKAVDVFTAGMQTGITNPARPWIRLGLEDKDLERFGPAKEWLENLRNLMLDVWRRSNFYRVTPTVYREEGLYGTALLFKRPDVLQTIRYYPATCGEYYIGQSDRLIVNTIYREFGLTAMQMEEQFGKEAMSGTANTLLDTHKLHSPVNVVHSIEPNSGQPIDGLDEIVFNRKYRSIYWESSSDDKSKVLLQEGFDEFPAMVPRFDVNSTEIYGYGPGHRAIGDVKSLQHHELMREEGIEKSIRPPLKAPASLRRSRINQLPNGITWYDDTQKPDSISTLYDVNYNPQFAQIGIDAKSESIEEYFFNDLFKMITNLERGNADITAREIDERREEKLFLLSPTVERNNDEFLDPNVDATFAEMVRTGQVPPPPPELEGLPLRIEYVSILADAMKLIGIQSIERFTNYVISTASASGDPTILDRLDVDNAAKRYGDFVGAPPDLIRTDEEVKAIRDQRAQKQAGQEGLDVAEQAADAAKTASETETASGSALDRVLERAGVS